MEVPEKSDEFFASFLTSEVIFGPQLDFLFGWEGEKVVLGQAEVTCH